jgi:hypothetical protein
MVSETIKKYLLKNSKRFTTQSSPPGLLKPHVAALWDLSIVRPAKYG